MFSKRSSRNTYKHYYQSIRVGQLKGDFCTGFHSNLATHLTEPRIHLQGGFLHDFRSMTPKCTRLHNK